MAKTRKRIILAKTEASYGVDSSPIGSANAILVNQLSITPLAGDTVSRDLLRPYLGNDLEIHVGTHVMVEFQVELAGAGAVDTPPAWGPLLLACGMAQTINASTSVEYAPVSDNEGSATLYFHQDGSRHILTGARGTFGITLDRNAIPYLRFSFTGLWNDPSATADPVPDFSDFVVPIPTSNVNTPTFTLHGVSPVLYSLSYEHANDVVHRDLVGEESVIITDRAPSGSVEIDAPALGTKNYFTTAKANTTGALQLVHGTAAGNIVQLDAPAVQLTQPTYGDQDGIATLQMGMQLVPGASGNDEFTITTR